MTRKVWSELEAADDIDYTSTYTVEPPTVDQVFKCMVLGGHFSPKAASSKAKAMMRW